jgi:hypothetical protein
VPKNPQLLVLNLAARVVFTWIQGLMTRKTFGSKCTGGKIRHRITKGKTNMTGDQNTARGYMCLNTPIKSGGL